MRFYANCNSFFGKNDIILKDEANNIRFIIKYFNLKKATGLKIYNDRQKEIYKVYYTPLQIKNQYMISNMHNHPVAIVGFGKKLIHVIEYNNHHYVCKGSFLKMNYRLYDQDNEIVSLRVVRKALKRFYEITIDEKTDIMFAMTMLIVAQTMKDRVWFIYGI
ncbi:MAG: hypothetical protein JXR62_01770 [Bacilli bacterium]|nr:hypothetical protein [Bacilli bacterium]